MSIGKYVKYTLILLYLAQLIVVFHEQLARFYRSALQTMHRETAAQEEKGWSGTFVTLLIPAPVQTIHTLASSRTEILTTDATHHNEPEYHQDDSRHDRTRKQKKPMRYEFLLLNLFPMLRVHRAAPSTSEARENVRCDAFRLAHVA